MSRNAYDEYNKIKKIIKSETQTNEKNGLMFTDKSCIYIYTKKALTTDNLLSIISNLRERPSFFFPVYIVTDNNLSIDNNCKNISNIFKNKIIIKKIEELNLKDL